MSRPLQRREELLRELVQALRGLSSRWSVYSQAAAERFSMNPTDLECLHMLDEGGPMTAGQLAELMALTTGAITGLVDRLEKGGYVTRERDPGDRRRVIIRPVEERLGKIRPLHDSLRAGLAEVCSDYTGEQVGTIIDFLKRSMPLLQGETERLRAEVAPQRVVQANTFTAPIEGARGGRLIFPRGAADLTVRGEPMGADLLRGQFDGPQPLVQVREGSVSVQQKHKFLGGPAPGELVLNSDVPWRVEVRRGMSGLSLDLRGVRLEALSLSGGISQTEVRLPEPAGTVPIRIGGGLDKLSIWRPSGTEARVYIGSGAADLTLEGKHIGKKGGVTRWETPGYSAAAGRYDIEIKGGIDQLVIEAEAS